MTAYSFLLIAIWAVFIIVWAVTAQAAKASAGGKGIGRWLLTRALFVAALIVLLKSPAGAWAGALSWRTAASPAAASLGVLLAALGVGFAIWARLHLGRNWGMPMTERKDPELVTSGPYAYVRHPIYTGVLLAIFGSALASGFPWLAVFAVACVYFLYAARQEEQVMRKRFPAAYPAYAARTKMLVPFLL